LHRYIYIPTEIHPPGEDTEFPKLRYLHDAFTANIFAKYTTACSLWALARKMAPIPVLAARMGREVGHSLDEIIDLSRKFAEKLPRGASVDELANGYLRAFLNDPPGMRAAQSLLRQCLVLLWSAFEILCSDGFVKLLNANPSKVSALLNADKTKKLFPVKDLIVQALEDHKFDVSRKMGSILIQHRRMDNLETIRTVYDALFPDKKELSKGLNQRELWNLYMVRNLIVHRAAVVDDVFLK